MSESVNEKQNNDNNESLPDVTTRIPLNPGDIEVTQKINIDYKEIAGNATYKKVLISKASQEHKKDTSSSVLGKSIFSRRRIADDYVKSSSILFTINSVPPLKDKIELQDITGNYELKEQIASGSQGVIRNAFDKSLKRNIVVKSLKTDGESEEHALKDESLFVSEARIMAQLDHPSIIPLYGLHSGKESKLHLAMKHIHGKTMQKYLEDVILLYAREGVENFDEKRSMANRIEYLIKVCEAIDYAHCKGVIHRDIKPENIMIGNYGEVYVMDWGLACLENPSEEESAEIAHPKDELVGTPCYIAPEIIRGGCCSPQSDIFSLGMILFEIVTLEKAVPGKTVKEVLQNIVNWNYRPFKHRFIKSKMPPDLKSIVVKAIREPASERYKSAADLAKDLRLYLMREETSARPDNIFRKCMRTMVNHKLITSTIILCIMLCFAGITIHSLYEQNILINKQKQRENMLAFFQYEVSKKAHDMERIFSFFKSQLANLGYQSGQAMTHKPVTEPVTYTMSDYQKPESSPPDYKYSPAYGEKISLDFSVLRLGDRVKLEDDSIRKLVTLQPLLKHIMFKSDRLLMGKNADEVKKIISSKGATLSWVYIALKDGSIMCYPGGDIYKNNYDPRQRLWYKNALDKKHHLVWSEPYMDAFSSKIVMTCVRCIYNTNEEFQGVVGMDISLDYIQNHMFENKTEDLKEYLLTKDGKVLLSSDFESKKAETSKGALVLNDFPFMEEFKITIKEKTVLFEAEKHGKKYIFALNEIPSMGYYYLLQVSEEKLRTYWKKNSSKKVGHKRDSKN